MPFTLDEVVPWGRSLDEYRRMFALGPGDLRASILGCADGPASFNAELTAAGGRVVSVDPLYRFSGEQIGRRLDETFDVVMGQTAANAEEFAWGPVVRDLDHLGEMRRSAMRRFLDDYEAGRREGRYVEGELPSLPFPDRAFDLALCSHFLFLYSAQLPADLHLRSLVELGRVAAEVRVFPLLELGSRRSRHLDALLDALPAEGLEAEVVRVDYEFQRGGDEMLRVRAGVARPPR